MKDFQTFYFSLSGQLNNYCKYQNLQQFNEKMVQNIIKEFDPKKFEIKFAKFKEGTWSETNAKSCSKCEIKNIDNSNKSNK